MYKDFIYCPYCEEPQDLDDIGLDKEYLFFSPTTLECEDCEKKYKLSTYKNSFSNWGWKAEKIKEIEEPEKSSKVEDVPGQLFFWENLLPDKVA